ncbi:MAG: alpha/beta hydrolase [Alphaproteobacteria bacterium]|nr:alpha/beta hydrolase [Alphaproteobacteria bacterium]
MRKVDFNSSGIKVVGNMFFPDDFDEKRQYPALIFTHPAGGVKEQTSGIYAEKFAKYGYITLAYDASYQGESEGIPIGFENPSSRVGDIHSAVDYFTTVPYIDKNKIGGVGICAGGGYMIKAAQTDHRIKAIVGVSPLDMGLVFREGLNGNDPDAVFGILDQVATARTAEANGAAPIIGKWTPDECDPNTSEEMKNCHDFYKNRAKHPRSTGEYPFINFDRVVEFSSFDEGLAKLFRQPAIIFIGDRAGTAWLAKRAYDLMHVDKKELVIIKDADHFDLYDHKSDEVVEKAVYFLKEVL